MLPDVPRFPSPRGQTREIAGRADRIEVRWLGTAGFEIRCDDHLLLIDPYFTRASLPRVLRPGLAPDPRIVLREAPRADAIIVGHTHFDHALDVPLIARATGARVYGSRSAAALCRADGVPPDQIVDVESALRRGGHEAEVGPFRLRFLPSAHSRLLFGRAVPFAGEIVDCDELPAHAAGYRCGAVFAVEIEVARRRIVHLGSAELEASTRSDRDCDLLLFCAAGWQTSPRIAERALAGFRPGAVLLSHWDDFLRPLDREVRPLPALSLPRLVAAFAAAGRDVPVGIVAPREIVTL